MFWKAIFKIVFMFFMLLEIENSYGVLPLSPWIGQWKSQESIYLLHFIYLFYFLTQLFFNYVLKHEKQFSSFILRVYIQDAEKKNLKTFQIVFLSESFFCFLSFEHRTVFKNNFHTIRSLFCSYTRMFRVSLRSVF